MSDATAPQNQEAEESVLGAMLVSSAAIDNASEHLEPDHFYLERHRTIYRAIVALHMAGTIVDPISVADHLEITGHLARIGGSGYLHQLANMLTATANAAHHARIVTEMAQLRSLITAGQNITRLGYERPGETRDLLEQAEQIVYGLAHGRSAGELLPVRDSLADTYHAITTMGDDVITGTPTGFHALDHLTTGFQPGNLVVLAARPSMGKSSLALCAAVHIACDKGLPVAVFTLEMSRREIDQRLLALRSGVKLQKIRNGRLTAQDASDLLAAAEELQDAPIYVDDTADTRPMEIRSRARRLKSRHGLALVVIDYLQLMATEQRHENRVQEVSQLSRALKVLARDLEVPVLALSQLNRRLEDRPNKRPMLSDLRESGSIEQDADIVLFVYRDGYYQRLKDPAKPDKEAELIIGKHRNGPLDTIHLVWDGGVAEFSNKRLV